MSKIRFAVLLCFSACTEQARDQYAVLSVAELDANMAELNGETVSVRGWLTNPCGELSCAIFPASVEQDQAWPNEPHLSIAAETLVEPALVANQGKEVVLRGVISSQCRSDSVLCTDRAPDITPVSLALVRPASKDI